MTGEPLPPRVRLVAFDVDGTLIDEIGFVWKLLHDGLGTDADERQKSHDDYFAGRITYPQWCDHDAALLIGKGATRENLRETIRPLRLMNGARETLAALRERGVRLAVLSGSVDIALDWVLPEWRDWFDAVYLNRLVFDGDGALSGIVPTPFDIEHKATGLRELSARFDIPLEECGFVGDNYNDVEVAKIAGVSVAFNCRSEALAAVAHHIVPEKDLRAVLPHLLP